MQRLRLNTVKSIVKLQARMVNLLLDKIEADEDEPKIQDIESVRKYLSDMTKALEMSDFEQRLEALEGKNNE